MAFPTTSVLTDFTAANGDLDVRDTRFSKSIFGTESNTMAITSNQCKSPSGVQTAWWNAASFGPDCEVFATVIATGGNFSNLYLRLVTPGSSAVDGYKIRLFSSSAAVFRIDNGVQTQLGSTMAWTLAANDVAGADMVGSTITVYQNGTAVDNRSDGTYTAAGFIGLGADSNGPILDDFGGGTIGAVAGNTYTASGMGVIG